MSRQISMITLCLILAGCSATPTQTYRPAGYTGTAWTIDGKLNMGLVDNEVIILINNKEVIRGKMSDFVDHAEFSGEYEGYKINASCSHVSTWSGTKVQCVVFCDGERAATLQF